MAKIDDYIALADELIGNDRDRDLLYSGIDDMWHGNWKADADLKAQPDFREVIDLSPHDALRAGTTIMVASMPKWTVQPFATNEEERARAEKIEYILDWHFRQMNQRGTGTVLWDIVHSALRYDMVAIWLDYLPIWIGKNPTGRTKNALRNGPFVPTVHNPRFVHVRTDSYGENAVLHASSKNAQEVANYWKSRDKKQSKGLASFLEDLEKRKGEKVFFNLCDLMLYDEDEQIRRVVWGSITDSDSMEIVPGSQKYTLTDEVVKTPFMNWIVKVGGSKMETESKYSVHPLLAPLFWTHKWKDQNISESIVYSEIIKMARAPRIIDETPSGEGLEIDFTAGSTIHARTGLDKAQAFSPAPLDPNMKELLDRGKASISSATLPRILQNPEFAGNTPFASINAIMQTAINSMNNAKVICQVAMQELGLRILEWANYADDTLYAYREKPLKGKDGSTIEAGTEVALTPADYHPDHLVIAVELSTDSPIDSAQRLNGVITMVERLDYPKQAALEDLGQTNAELLVERRTQEKYDEMTVNADLQTILGDAQLSIQKKQMQLQMEAQQAMAQQQQAAQPNQAEPPSGQNPMAAQLEQMAQQQGGYPSNQQGNPPTGGGGIQKGEGFNPNMGGYSPAVGNPGANNREQVTGTDVTGKGIG